MPKSKTILFIILAFFLNVPFVQSQDTYDSGGPLLPEQAAYDVLFYDLQLRIDPAAKSISGSNAITFQLLEDLEKLPLDFDARFAIDSIRVDRVGGLSAPADHERINSRIWVDLSGIFREGDKGRIIVFYHGQPREAPNPPWDGGFSWQTTPEGQPWVSVSCQNNGADIWWPCKDHPSDEPDSMSIKITVPEGLVCISNGQLRETAQNDDGSTTFYWFVSTPINNYGVSVYIGPYQIENIPFTSRDGQPFEMGFAHLQGHGGDYASLINEIPKHIAFFENILGPYPFRNDKYYAVQAPYLGMEHQTIIAYGASPGYHYGGYDQGFDGLHLHELAHEWWGNMVTASDWKDFWLHEGFATYMEALYAEHLNGFEGYQDVMSSFAHFRNQQPIAPTTARSTQQMYSIDIYYKGAWVLHTLRYVLGDSLFFESLQRFLYPDPALKGVIDGRQCHFISTEDLIATVSEVSSKDMTWFFDVYVRRAQLPVLMTYIRNNTFYLEWKTSERFPIDVPVKIGDEIKIVDMGEGSGHVQLDPFVLPQVDPQERILKTLVRTTEVAQNRVEPEQFSLEKNYPNPFNTRTVFSFVLPEKSRAQLTIYDLQGKQVDVVLDRQLESGMHHVNWDAGTLPSGVYIYKLKVGNRVAARKLTIIK